MTIYTNVDERERGVAVTDELLVTVEEAARRLGIGRTTAYELVLSGRLLSVKLGRARRIAVVALERFVEEQLLESQASQ